MLTIDYFGAVRLNHHSDVIMSMMASQITSLTIIYPTVYPGAEQRKHQSSASLAFVRRIHQWTVYSPHKGPVTRKMFPFDDDIRQLCLVILFALLPNKMFGCSRHGWGLPLPSGRHDVLRRFHWPWIYGWTGGGTQWLSVGICSYLLTCEARLFRPNLINIIIADALALCFDSCRKNTSY